MQVWRSEGRGGEAGLLSCVEKEAGKPGQNTSEVHSWLNGDLKHHLSHWFKATEARCAHPEGTEVMLMNRSDC